MIPVYILLGIGVTSLFGSVLTVTGLPEYSKEGFALGCFGIVVMLVADHLWYRFNQRL